MPLLGKVPRSVQAIGCRPLFHGFFTVRPYEPHIVAVTFFTAELVGQFEQDGSGGATVIGTDIAGISQRIVGVVMTSDYDDAVTLSASAGTVTQNGNGTWSWSGTGDESSPYTVTITATNADGSTATTSFGVSFTDVPPTVAANRASVTVAEGTTASNAGTFADFDDPVTITASVTTTVKVLAPAVVGVPDTRPDGSKASPAAREPALIDQRRGAVPPVALSGTE